MSAATSVTHAPGPDGLLGSAALCGATTETHDLRLADAGVDCAVCLDMTPTLRVMSRGEMDAAITEMQQDDVPCPIQGHEHAMSECDGNI